MQILNDLGSLRMLIDMKCCNFHLFEIHNKTGTFYPVLRTKTGLLSDCFTIALIPSFFCTLGAMFNWLTD